MATGGVGEAMLIGAVTGAGTSAVTGGDPLKGALLGAAGAGAFSGAAGATGGAASGAAGAAPITPASAAIPGVNPGNLANVASTSGTLTTAQAGLPEAVGQIGTSVMPSGANLQSTMLPSGDIALTDAQRNILASQGAPTAPASGFNLRPPTPGMDDAREGTKYFPNLAELYGRNPVLGPAAAGAVTSAAFNPFEEEEKEDERYRGALSRFSYSPDRYTSYAASGGLMDTAPARRMAAGGQLGSYSDGGQTLQGPGDGMSDSIPASIGGTQPARLADGEFVVPADVVSGIGNGSTDAGARQLYSMMDKVREARTGRTRQAPEINPRRMMPA